jgi:hypothetical protein
MIGSRRNWVIWIEHEAFGTEGLQSYFGSELGARRAAGKIAREAGHGWMPGISEQFDATEELAAPCFGRATE